MLRVLLLVKGLGRGGTEQLLTSTVRHADRDRFRFEVAYLLPWKDALVEELRDEGASVTCLDGARGVGWIRRLRNLADRVDLVHAHSPYPAIAARAVLPRRLPFVYTEHNQWPRYHRATYWGNALTYARNDHVFAVSDHVLHSISYPRPLRFRRMPPLETLLHGPDPTVVARSASADGVRAELEIPESDLLVGTIANLKAHKGIQYLLAAIPLVRRTYPSTRFVVVGQGPLERDLKRLSVELGVEDDVVFAGYRDDAPRIAHAFDVFVMASLHEGLPIALLEAMSLGRPSVVTNVGGLPEIVDDGGEGLIVPPADPGALANAIVRLLGDPDLRARCGSGARRRAAAFDITGAVRRMEQVWEGVSR